MSLIPDLKPPKGRRLEKRNKVKQGETRRNNVKLSIIFNHFEATARSDSLFPAEQCQEMSRIALIQRHEASTLAFTDIYGILSASRLLLV